MRLWHKDLIPVLPKQQLVAQWRECCLIAREISIKGTPNHLLVNKLLNYPIGHFWKYIYLVLLEMENRGYRCDFSIFEKWIDKPYTLNTPDTQNLFKDWHNDRYLTQCFYNLQEKYDCCGISYDEWRKIEDKYHEIIPASN